jgi:hypothetical protein
VFVLWKGARVEAIGGLKLAAKLVGGVVLALLVVALVLRMTRPYVDMRIP